MGLIIIHHAVMVSISPRFNPNSRFSGVLGEDDPAGGDSSQQVLQPVEEAEGEGDPAGDLWERQGNYPTNHHLINISTNHLFICLHECQP